MEVLFPAIVTILLSLYAIRKSRERGKGGIREFKDAAKQGVERIASDGHKINAKDDISCARYGHDHSRDMKQEGFPDAQYIVHNEPQEGYINLNGKILKRSEADEYMRRHG